jgi:hypothetical protein
MHSLVRNIHIHQLRTDIIEIRIDHVYRIDQISLMPSQDGARVSIVHPAILVVQIPLGRDFELARADGDRHLVRLRSGGGKKGAANREHPSIGEDRVCGEDELRHAREEGVYRGVWDEEGGDAGGGKTLGQFAAAIPTNPLRKIEGIVAGARKRTRGQSQQR